MKQNKKKPKSRAIKRKKLDEVDRELLRLVIEKPTRTYQELADLTGLGKSQVWQRIRSELFMRELEILQKSAIEILTNAKERAAQRLVEIIESTQLDAVVRVCIRMLEDVLPAKRLAVAHSGGIKNSHTMTDEAILAEIETLSEELGQKSLATQYRRLLSHQAAEKISRAEPASFTESKES